jgi:hypothetical protein
LPIRLFPNEAIIADHLTNDGSVFLFNKTLIVFQIRASPREGDVFLFAIGDQHFIDKLATVIGIDPQDRKGEERACPLEGSEDRFLTPVVSCKLKAAHPRIWGMLSL